MLAAYNAMEAAIRMLRPGLYKNMEITDMIDKIANIYQVYKSKCIILILQTIFVQQWNRGDRFPRYRIRFNFQHGQMRHNCFIFFIAVLFIFSFCLFLVGWLICISIIRSILSLCHEFPKKHFKKSYLYLMSWIFSSLRVCVSEM